MSHIIPLFETSGLTIQLNSGQPQTEFLKKNFFLMSFGPLAKLGRLCDLFRTRKGYEKLFFYIYIYICV